MKTRDIILITCYFLYTSMFLYAAVYKLLNFHIFFLQMKSQPFDERVTPLLVYGIPIVEICASIMMLTIRFRKTGMYLSTALMTCFTIYIIIIKLNFFDKIPCSCGGVISSFTWTQHLFFNLFYLFIGGIAIYLEQSPKEQPSLWHSTYSNK